VSDKSELLLEFINTRRSVRSFVQKPISKNDIEDIVEAGLRAPSSKNSQPWYILVLQGEDKDKVCDWVLSRKDEVNFGLPEMIDGMKTESPLNSTLMSLDIIKDSQALILIFNRGPFTGGSKERGKDPSRDVLIGNELVGIGACMENMLLAAHAIGLGAVAMMDIWPAAERIKAEYSIDYDFVVGLAIGKSDFSSPKRKIEPEKFSRFV